MSPQPRKVTLADLDDGTRAALLLELQQEQDKVRAAKRSEAEVHAENRRRATLELMHERDHMRDCPTGRVEAYEARRPPKPDAGIPAADVTVVRCVECGGATVLEKPYPVTVAELEQRAAEIADQTEEVEIA